MSDAPKITLEQINAMMADRVQYTVEQPAGFTSTFVHAYLDGKFYLATGHSACVSPENFNAELGVKYARQDAEKKASNELWKLEGYALFKELNK